MVGLLVTCAILGVLGYFVWVGYKENDRAAAAARFEPHKVAADISRPEKHRRAEIINHLIENGYVISRQEEGYISAAKPKPKFSILLFLITLPIFGLGLLYLLAWATKKQDVLQYTLLNDG